MICRTKVVNTSYNIVTFLDNAKSIDDIFNELASLGVNVKWLKEGGISYKAAFDLLVGLKALPEVKATHRRSFVLP